jgi:pSer/pThr/pTyr-binding forkhead associated (FHA) protein
MLYDLGSSGGTFVNGKKITKVSLHPGDVISLAGVPIVYGQDARGKTLKTRKYISPSQTEEGSTLSGLNLKDIDLDPFNP